MPPDEYPKLRVPLVESCHISIDGSGGGPHEIALINTLVHFEYRKICRQYGGSILNPHRTALLSVAVVLMWLASFGIYTGDQKARDK